jgi:tetratricopeptide (TPR) repeat protein
MSPRTLQRRLLEIEGWMELRAHDLALERIDALQATVEAGLLNPIRARCLLAMGRFGEAVGLYEELVGGSGAEAGALLELAWCHKRIGRPDLAAGDMEKLIASDPESSIGHYNLACYLSLSGRPERALAELGIAIALEPRFAAEARGERDFDPIRHLPQFDELARSAPQEETRRKPGETA